MTLFKKSLRLSQIHDLCISRQKTLIFSKGHRVKIEFLIFLPSSIILEAIKKKLGTCSFPKYFYANLPDVRWHTAAHVGKEMDGNSVSAKKTSNYKAEKSDK